MTEAEAEKSDNPQKSANVLAAEEEIRKLLIVERRKKISERRALRIVLQLAKRRVTVDFLCLALNFIEPQHWDDAVDERNAEGLCGYVFCAEKPLISQGKKQRYRICSKTNRVYDMESYNPFCSVWCAKASKHVRSQIEEKPMSQRKEARRLTLTFLDQDLDQSGTGQEAVKDQPEENDEKGGGEWREEEEPEAEEKEKRKEEVEEEKSSTAETECSSLFEGKKTKHSVSASRRSQREPEALAPRVPPLHGAKTALRSWITADSLAWLEGRSLSAGGDEETEAYRGKVRHFFGRKSEPQEKEEDEVEVTLPLVDSVSQDAIRRRIVSAKLDTCFRDLAPALQLDLEAVRTPLRQLLRSFAFSASNIVLRPREWRAASVLLLEMVARREAAVREALDAEGAAAVLLSFAEEPDLGLQELVDECAMLTVD